MLPALLVFGSIAYSGVRALWQQRQPPAPALLPVAESEPPAAIADGVDVPATTDVSAKPTENTDRPSLIIPEPAIDHYLRVLGVATATSVAAIFFPPVRIIAVGMLSYTITPLLEDAFRSTFIDRKFRASQVDSLVVTISLLNGYYLLTSVGSIIYFSSLKLIHRTRARSKSRLGNLFGENPRHIWLSCDNTEVEVPFESLQLGNIIVLQAGEFIPIDGTIVSGIATIDQRTLTGESHPVEKTIGDTVFASTTLVAGKLFVRVDKTGAQTTASSIQRILDNTENYTNTVEQEAIRFSNSLAGPTLLAGGVGTLFLTHASTIALVGCNLSDLNRVSGPIGILNYLDLTAERGILVKDGRSLELLQSVDTVVFDKTGTLTLDQPELGQIHELGSLSELDLLQIAATAEARQSHPIANAILAAASARGIVPAQMDNARYEIGYGLKVEVEGRVIHLGSARFMQNEGVIIVDPAKVESIQFYCDRHGFSLIYVAYDHTLVGAIEMHSAIRPEARAVIAQLRARGLDLYIVSGDHDEPTKRLAGQLDIPHYFANVLPDQKAKIIQDLRTGGKSICFVGDGINDAVALKTANVGVSIHGASDAALDTAGIILMDRTLNQLGNLFDFSDELARNRKHCYYATMIPSALGACAVVTLGLGLSAALVLYIVGAGASLTTANMPRIMRKTEKYKKQTKVLNEPRIPPQSGNYD